MKRLLTMIVAVCAFFAVSAQNRQQATLSHNGELTSFTGMYALEQAIKASETGDIIYLSEGEFVSSENQLFTINKKISIVGCGSESHIISQVYIYENDNENDIDETMPFFDGVRLNILNFSGNDRLKYFSIRNCRIQSLWSCGKPIESHIDRCYIEELGDFYDYDSEVYLTNSKIGYARNGIQNANVTNCNIKDTYFMPRIVLSSIIETIRGFDGRYNTVYNTLLNQDLTNEPLYHDCYLELDTELLDENLDCTIDLQAKGYLGQDGTIIGAYGGENPFSEYPSVPTIDSEKSSVEFDAAGNKLNVTITVAN